jgi:peptidyl-prolyl cis-trans isomerase SurA
MTRTPIVVTGLVVIMLVLAVTPGYSQSQQVLDRIAAIVDDDIILESEVVQSAYLMALQSGVNPTQNPGQFEREFEKYKNETLQNLINKKVLLIQAEEDTIQADERMVEYHLKQQMQNVTQKLGGSDAVADYFGISLSKVRKNYREQIEEELKVQRVREMKLAMMDVSRREVEEFYKNHQDSIDTIQETVELRHILMVPEPGEESKAKARETIETIRERLAEGDSFAELAKEYSEDPGSASRGGDLGLMGRGEFVPEFEQVAFSLEPGDISDEIVETQFGFHIIKLEERRGEKVRVRHILISPKPTQADELRTAEKIKKVYNEIKEGAPFEEMVAKYSDDETTVEQDGYLGEFQLDQLKQTAKEFTYVLQDVEPGEISDPVKTDYGFHILKVIDRQQPRELDLKQDWERVKKMALEHKKQQVFKEWLSEIKQDVYIEIKDPITEYQR